MAKKNHPPGPVPPANRPQHGPPQLDAAEDVDTVATGQTGGDQEQDPDRTIGGFTGKGEASFHQPGGRNDADRRGQGNDSN